MNDPLKIHVGCGRVPLKGGGVLPGSWVNVDLERPGVFLSSTEKGKALAEKWATDDGDAYYAKQTATMEEVAKGPRSGETTETVCDVYGDALRGLPFPCNSVDEMLARQVLEHFSRAELDVFFRNMDYVVKPGGYLRLDWPDYEGALARIVAERDETWRAFLKRHILGPRNSSHGCHFGYTRDEIRRIAEEEWGFEYVCDEPPLAGRWYPAHCVQWQKPFPGVIDPLAWERHYKPGDIPDSWKVLEVGPGSRGFFPRANAVLDIVDRGPSDLPKGARFVKGDICQRTPFGDKEFSWAHVGHVLEHVEDPRAAAAEISRVAKAGLVECPHPFKEVLFAFDLDADHRWWVFPPVRPGGPLRFERPDADRLGRGLKSRDVSAAMMRILRSGPLGTSDASVLRRWFQRNHETLNVIHRWEGELRVEVIA